MAAREQALHQAASSPPPGERPWLLPCNRKLRHLQGIAVRNLTLTPAPSPSRSRGRPIDDDALPSALKSPTKALALRETRKLAHSRSSSDLQSSEDPAGRSNGDVSQPTSPTKLARPAPVKGLRRRSTLEWSGGSLLTRQKKLEDITRDRMADTFFSLHVDAQEEPVYISEVVERAMNPNFRFFDLGSCGPAVTRLDRVTVKAWAKNENTDGWQYLLEFDLQLRSLQFIGKTLGSFNHALPQNCILFYMTDGIYTSSMDLPLRERNRPVLLAPPKEHPDGRVLNSSSYDALMRLSTLDDCIQDALSTRDRIAEEIESILEDNRQALTTVEQVPEAEERLKTVQAAVVAEKRRVEAVRKRRDELKNNIQRRRELMHTGRELQTRMESELVEAREKHNETKQLVDKAQEDIAGQRRRICEDLQTVFPIEPMPGKSLAFTIRGLPLPNTHTEFDDAKEDVTAAALGYVAQVLSLLSPYFSVILPYPMNVNGSASTIEDPLAMNTGSQSNLRTFPLFMKGVVRYRFEYGVFLLNKNIEILSNTIGIRPLETRHTLPNLKYFLFVATAGKGELPARKTGGIKGLLRESGVISRKGSTDSTATASSVGVCVPEAKQNLEIARNTANGVPLASAPSLHKQKPSIMHGSRLREVS
ncbi:UV radiation resistance-associated gene protein [Massariosphaeria phaeospora]|uniref:Autophagy-related protein 14 n=1 Tax=Massariosphaeria phaeospora TaxID=100035 RepID=A0A7C8HYK7_9PLEO|nr:UV radiation resistance-associated gene protein [Massariosphaeria phaeospora]